MQAFAFAAHHDNGLRGPIDAVIRHLATLIQTVYEVAHVFQRTQGLIDIDRADHRQVFQRTSGGFRNGFGEPRGAALGDNHGTGSGGMRGADHGTEVVGIFHAIEDDEQVCGGRHIVEFSVFLFGTEGNEALMGFGAGEAIERSTIFKTKRDGGLPSEVDYLLDAGAAEAARDEDSIQRAAGAESFDNRVKSNEYGQETIIPRRAGPGAQGSVGYTGFVARP